MGDFDLTKFRARTQDRSQRTFTDTTRLDDLINAAILELAGAIPFRELNAKQAGLTIVAGTSQYALPTDLHYYRRGRITAPTDKRVRLRPMTEEEFFRKTDYDKRGTPSRYLVFDDQLTFYVTPDLVYTIEMYYQKRPAKLALATDKTVFAAEWDEAVVLGTVYRIYEEFQEHERAIVAKNTFIDYVRTRTLPQDVEEIPDRPLDVAWTESDLEIR